MVRLTVAAMLLSFLFQPARATDEPIRKKILIIGMDGLRPDALVAAHIPNLRGLIKGGAFAARASADSITRSGPGWAAILTGVWHDKNGVTNNEFTGYHSREYPSFLQRAKENRPDLFTAAIVNWKPIRDNLLPQVDFSAAPQNDDSVANMAARLLAKGDPDVLFLHFDAPDHAGHHYCFSRFSPFYLHAISQTDLRVGKVLRALANRPTRGREEWLILCTTDHGGSWRHHGANIPAHRRVFLIVAGDRVPHGQKIQGGSLVDVAPTALTYLGMPVDPQWGWAGKSMGLEESDGKGILSQVIP